MKQNHSLFIQKYLLFIEITHNLITQRAKFFILNLVKILLKISNLNTKMSNK